MQRTLLACYLCFNTGLSSHSGVVNVNQRRDAGRPRCESSCQREQELSPSLGPPVSNTQQMKWLMKEAAPCRGARLTSEHLLKSQRKCFLGGGGQILKIRCCCAYVFDDNGYICVYVCVYAVTNLQNTASLWCVTVYNTLADSAAASVPPSPCEQHRIVFVLLQEMSQEMSSLQS